MIVYKSDMMNSISEYYACEYGYTIDDHQAIYDMVCDIVYSNDNGEPREIHYLNDLTEDEFDALDTWERNAF